MTTLDIGASVSREVDPRPLFVSTGLEVAPAERYRFTATGKWRDWFLTVGPKGWWFFGTKGRCRLPEARVFCLCGCVGTDDKNAFAIGAGRKWVVPDDIADFPDRKLYLFANDWPDKYHNNYVVPPPDGPLRVEIARIA